MTPLLSAIVLTLFPEMFPGPLGVSLAGKALEKGIWSLEALNIRDFATDKHRTVDASPYGGGTGMVLKPDIVDLAIEAAKVRFKNSLPLREGLKGGVAPLVTDSPIYAATPHPTLPPQGGKEPIVIYTSPRGKPFTQAMAESLKNSELIIVCGRFEGLDQRVIDHHEMLEISLGDFVLSGGELAAMTVLDACVRLLPGVIGKEDALRQESFSIPADSVTGHSQPILASAGQNSAGLLEYPHYTRPPLWKGLAVPDILLSGNHEHINAWRLEQAKIVTQARRPDLMQESKKKE